MTTQYLYSLYWLSHPPREMFEAPADPMPPAPTYCTAQDPYGNKVNSAPVITSQATLPRNSTRWSNRQTWTYYRKYRHQGLETSRPLGQFFPID